MNLLADAVRQSYPDEAGYVNGRENDIMGMWDELQRKAAERGKALGDAEQQQKFLDDAKDVENWLNDTRAKLREKNVPHDVAEAEEFLKQHNDLLDDINANKEKWVRGPGRRYGEVGKWDSVGKILQSGWFLYQYRYKQVWTETENAMNENKNFIKQTCTFYWLFTVYPIIVLIYHILFTLTFICLRFDRLRALGEAILAKDPNNQEVRDKLRQMDADQRALEDLWRRKNDELLAAKELQIFLKEADQIDSVTASHEAFLEFDDLGVSVFLAHRSATWGSNVDYFNQICSIISCSYFPLVYSSYFLL